MNVLPRLRRSRSWLLLMISALILGVLPIYQAEARVVLKDLDNTVPQFVGGTFQRVESSDYQSSADSTDQKGAIELATVGLLQFKNQNSAYPLPVNLQAMGTAAIGNRIYVIGGISTSGAVSTVYSAAVDVTGKPNATPVVTPTGSILDPGWSTEAALNTQQGSLQGNLITPLAPISSPGVVTATVGTDHYIYVIGGLATRGTNDFSSYAVRYAKVGSDGHIVDTAASTTDGWQPLPGGDIPQNDATDAGSKLGLASSAVTSFTSTSGVTYIYILGGLQRGLAGSGGTSQFVSSGSRAIFVARVGANGLLYKANTSGDNDGNRGWQLSSLQIPVLESDIPNSEARASRGVWDAVAVAKHVPSSTNATYSDVLFLMGGQLAPVIGSSAATYSSKVFSFYIDPNGQLVSTGESLFLPNARRGHKGVEVGGTIYLTGGIPGNTDTPDRVALTSAITDSLSLPRIGGDGSPNFLQNDTGLPEARAFHGTVYVPNTTGTDGGGYIYVIGGRGATSGGTTSVFYSPLKENNVVKNSGFVADGWYYSKAFPLSGGNAVDVREISWLTTIPNKGSMDIAMDYRLSSDLDCKTLQNSRTVAWQNLDGDTGTARSLDGANTVEKTGINGRCFQYRAHLTTSAATNKITPQLLKVSVKIVIPGSADLKPTKLIQTKSGTDTTGVSAVIINHNDTPPVATNPTLAADIDGGGSFFVDLFVFEGAPVTPTLPLKQETVDSPTHVGCAQVPNSAMQPSAVYTITTWLDPTCSTPITVTAIFAKPNTTYSVLVAVDTGCPDNKVADVHYGCINEIDATGGEDNNIASTQMTIAGTKDVPIVNPLGKMPLSLPLMSKK